jgi:hypothetical protein
VVIEQGLQCQSGTSTEDSSPWVVSVDPIVPCWYR